MFWFPAFVLGIVVGAWSASFFREPPRKEIVLVFVKEPQEQRKLLAPPPLPPPNPSLNRRNPTPDFGM